jgi:ankyrin repeat protein
MSSPTPPSQRSTFKTKAQLLRALSNNNVEEVRQALNDDPLLAIVPIGRTADPPLLVALRHGCAPEILAVLMANGADANCISDDHSALKTVAKVAPATSVTLEAQVETFFAPASCGMTIPLLSMQTPVYQEPAWSPMHAFVSMPGAQRFLPSTVLTEKRCCDYAVCLLKGGANLNWQDQHGKKAADYAELSGHMPRLAYLLKHWGGDQAKSLFMIRQQRQQCRCTSDYSSIASCACIVCMPEEIYLRVRGMLISDFDGS